MLNAVQRFAIKITGEQCGFENRFPDDELTHYGPFSDISTAEGHLTQKRWARKHAGEEHEWSALLGRTRVISAKIIRVTRPVGFAHPNDLPAACVGIVD